MTASAIDRVLDALTEQDAVRYAVVTTRGGNTVAEAGDLPSPGERDTGDSPGTSLSGGSEAVQARVQTMVEVGEGRILHVGTARELPEPELQQLRSVVASAM